MQSVALDILCALLVLIVVLTSVSTSRRQKRRAVYQRQGSLLSAAEKAAKWRPGGLQQLAVHTGMNRLYSIMHQGDLDTHKDPGREVWVYDLAKRARIQKISMQHDSGSIQVSRDVHPLMFSIFIDSNVLDIYDATYPITRIASQSVDNAPTISVTSPVEPAAWYAIVFVDRDNSAIAQPTTATIDLVGTQCPA